MIDEQTKIYQGDDLRAFGGTAISLEVINETDFPIKKLIFKCGNVIREFEDLEDFKESSFIILIYLTSDETRLLNKSQKCYVACYDEFGHKQTIDGYYTLEANEEIIYDKIRS